MSSRKGRPSDFCVPVARSQDPKPLKTSSAGSEMPADRPRIYFDANVFLAYIGNEEGRADTVQTLLDEARRGEIEILTSVLSIAEVANGAHERDNGLTEAGKGVHRPAVDASVAGHPGGRFASHDAARAPLHPQGRWPRRDRAARW